MLFLICLCYGYYFWVTRSESIRQQAVAYLSEATQAQVKIAEAYFSMFNGITLYDVHVSTPYDKELDPNAVDPCSREIFSANSLIIYHSPWRLLLGELRIERIVATEPCITLTQNTDTGKRNWRSLFQKSVSGGPAKAPQRPLVTLRSAQVDMVSIEWSGHQLRRSTRLDADVRPHPQKEWAYCVDIRQLSPPSGQRVTVVFNPEDSVVENAPFIDVRTVGLGMPKAYQNVFQMFRLEGEAKVVKLTYSADNDLRRITELNLELRDVGIIIPASFWREHATYFQQLSIEPPGDLVAITEVYGQIKISGNETVIDLNGRLDSTACTVRGRLYYSSGFGFDLQFCFEQITDSPQGVDRIFCDRQCHEGLLDCLAKFEAHGGYAIACNIKQSPSGYSLKKFHSVIRAFGEFGSRYQFPYLATHRPR